MKSMYVKPEMTVRDSKTESYILCLSNSQSQIETTWDNQLGKERGDIWSDGEESTESLW